MYVDDSLLSRCEMLIFALKKLYSSYGYELYRMSKFEEYDLYAGNKDFLVSDNVLTFTDTNGKLMALKPDVTLSIIKNSNEVIGCKKKVYYNETIYRSDRDSGSFKEILQTGLECFGDIDEKDMCEVIILAAQSLKEISVDSVLMLSDLTIIEDLFFDLSIRLKKDLFKAIRERNIDEIERMAEENEISFDKIEILKELLECHGPLKEVKEKLDSVLKKLDDKKETKTFRSIIDELSQSKEVSQIGIDFSLIDDLNYYNGIIFKGYVASMASSIVSGGQYDKLMKKMKKGKGAIGFAVYSGLIDQLGTRNKEEGYLNVALPKGRLGEKVYCLFAKAGYECPELLEENRRLVFENKEKKIRFFWVKPADTVIYVKEGVADIGVAGKDVLLENGLGVYELLDLKLGRCRMAVAGVKDFEEAKDRPLKVATKFPKIASRYYESKGRDIDIIKLNGSIEIAPLLGLSDVIVDIVETGRTLKENGLEVIDPFMEISARLIANHSAYAFKAGLIKDLIKDLTKIVREEK